MAAENHASNLIEPTRDSPEHELLHHRRPISGHCGLRAAARPAPPESGHGPLSPGAHVQSRLNGGYRSVRSRKA